MNSFTNTTAFNEGYTAERGSKCPYQKDTTEYTLWILGRNQKDREVAEWDAMYREMWEAIK